MPRGDESLWYSLIVDVVFLVLFVIQVREVFQGALVIVFEFLPLRVETHGFSFRGVWASVATMLVRVNHALARTRVPGGNFAPSGGQDRRLPANNEPLYVTRHREEERTMAFLEDVFSGWGGIAVGVGAAIIGPSVLPALGTVVRPIVKGLVKGTLFVSDQAMALAAQVSALAAEAGEQVGDLVAEATAEAKSVAKARGARA